MSITIEENEKQRQLTKAKADLFDKKVVAEERYKVATKAITEDDITDAEIEACLALSEVIVVERLIIKLTKEIAEISD